MMVVTFRATQGLLGDDKPFRTEVIAQKIESSLDPAYQG